MTVVSFFSYLDWHQKSGHLEHFTSKSLSGSGCACQVCLVNRELSAKAARQTGHWWTSFCSPPDILGICLRSFASFQEHLIHFFFLHFLVEAKVHLSPLARLHQNGIIPVLTPSLILTSPEQEFIFPVAGKIFFVLLVSEHLNPWLAVQGQRPVLGLVLAAVGVVALLKNSRFFSSDFFWKSRYFTWKNIPLFRSTTYFTLLLLCCLPTFRQNLYKVRVTLKSPQFFANVFRIFKFRPVPRHLVLHRQLPRPPSDAAEGAPAGGHQGEHELVHLREGRGGQSWK